MGGLTSLIDSARHSGSARQAVAAASNATLHDALAELIARLERVDLERLHQDLQQAEEADRALDEIERTIDALQRRMPHIGVLAGPARRRERDRLRAQLDEALAEHRSHAAALAAVKRAPAAMRRLDRERRLLALATAQLHHRGQLEQPLDRRARQLVGLDQVEPDHRAPDQSGARHPSPPVEEASHAHSLQPAA